MHYEQRRNTRNQAPEQEIKSNGKETRTGRENRNMAEVQVKGEPRSAVREVHGPGIPRGSVTGSNAMPLGSYPTNKTDKGTESGKD